MRHLSRRAALALGAGGAALSVVGWGSSAFATPEAAAAEIAKFTGGKQPTKGKVAIELPEIAENGNTVPLSVSVDAPMTADDYVSEVLVLAEHNPLPRVAHFHFCRCRQRRKPRPASGLRPPRTSLSSPRPARAGCSPARSW